MFSSLSAICWALLVTLSSADVRHQGACPNLSENATVTDFQPAQFVGQWYVISGFGPDAACVSLNYTGCGSGCLRVQERRQLSFINSIGLSNVYQRDGLLQSKKNGSGVMTASYTDTTAQPEYRVLATDYDSFAAVYRCRNMSMLGALPLFHHRSVLVLHRDRNGTLSPDQTVELGELLIENQIEDESERVVQEGCIRSEEAALDINTSRFVQRVTQGVNTVANGVSNLYTGALRLFGIRQ